MQDLSDSICHRDRYSEWVVGTHKVLGISAAPDYEVRDSALVSGNPEGPTNLLKQSTPQSADELRTLFKGWNIYSFDDDRKCIVMWTNDGKEPIEHSAIYKG